MTNPLSSSSSPSLPDTAAVAPAPAPAPTSSGTPRSSTSTAAAPPAATTPPAASGAASTRDDTNGNGNSNDRPATSAPSNAPSSSSKSHRRSSTSGVSSLRSSFLSRLSLPLPNRAKNRHILEFHISPHEPHKRYSPGDHVRGSVKVVLVKPLRITHLTVALSGYVRVFKDPTVRAQGSTQDVTALLPQGGSKRPQYHGNGFASLFQDEQVLSGDGRLDAGKYEFGFDLVFPSKGLPSSIDVSSYRVRVAQDILTNTVRARYHIIHHLGDINPADLYSTNYNYRQKNHVVQPGRYWASKRPLT